MARVWFEPKTPAFERAMTIHALDRAATVIGNLENRYQYFGGICCLRLQGSLKIIPEMLVPEYYDATSPKTLIFTTMMTSQAYITSLWCKVPLTKLSESLRLTADIAHSSFYTSTLFMGCLINWAPLCIFPIHGRPIFTYEEAHNP
jgi:hypothetical protein